MSMTGTRRLLPSAQARAAGSDPALESYFVIESRGGA